MQTISSRWYKPCGKRGRVNITDLRCPLELLNMIYFGLDRDDEHLGVRDVGPGRLFRVEKCS